MDCQKIGNIIYKQRKQLNMTQLDLANILHISDRTVSKWERGGGCPDISLIIPLSEALEISLYELLGGKEMSKDSKIKADEIIKSTINMSSREVKIKNIIDIILITVSSIIIIGIGLFWGFVKFHYAILWKPENVKYSTLVELKEKLNYNFCTLTLADPECELSDGTFVHLVNLEYNLNLPKWYVGAYIGYEKDLENKQLSLKIEEEGYKENNINKYRLDKNYTKKSMIVNSLVYFLFIEDLESMKFDFGDNIYIIKKEEINSLFTKKYVEIEDLLKNDNWKKHVIKNLNQKDFISEYFVN